MNERDMEIMCDIFLFEGCEFEPLIPILERAEIDMYYKNDYIYSANRYKHAMGVILGGSAVVQKGHLVILKTISIGDCFGVASLFNDSEHYVSTIVAQRPTTVLFLTDMLLAELFDANPRTAVNYIRFLSQRICFLNQKLDSFTAPSAESRIALFLLENMNDDGIVDVKSGYTSLARFLGMGRASLYRCLDSFSDAGALTRHEKQIAVLDKAKLEEISPTNNLTETEII